MKIVILPLFILLITNFTFAAEYIVPKKPASVDVSDIDLDGGLDIVLGHDYPQGDFWGMISILANNGIGEFALVDSLSTYAYETSIQVGKVNNNEYPDIIANDYNVIINSPVFTIINDYGLTSWNNITQFCYDNITIYKYRLFKTELNDLANLVFISNINYLWGALYNNGSGQFSEPEYYNLDYPPTGIDVGNLNEDTREDIVISGQTVEIYFNYESGLDCYQLGVQQLRVKIADVDNDGDNDIIGLSSILGTGWITIYENLGDSNFYEHDQFLFQSDTSYLQVSDLNNNGLIDLICSGSYNNGIYILYNNGNFDFSEPQFYFTGEDTRKVHCADLDNNNYNDIIALTHYTVAPDFGRLHILFNDGNGNFVEEPQVGINDEFIIKNNKCNLTIHPNPFNPSTNIKFTTSKQGFVEINICNIKGVFVKKLIKQNLVGGEHNVIWNGKDRNNQHCSSGIYLMNLKVDGKTEAMKKCLLLK